MVANAMVKTLREQRTALSAKARAVMDAAEKDKRDVTAEEAKSIETTLDELEGVRDKLSREDRLTEFEADEKREAADAPAPGSRRQTTTAMPENAPGRGFTYGHKQDGTEVRGFRHGDRMFTWNSPDTSVEELRSLYFRAGAHELRGEPEKATMLMNTWKRAVGGGNIEGDYAYGDQVLNMWIDLKRAKSRVSEAGAIFLKVQGTDLVAIPRRTADPTWVWRNEGATITESSPTWDLVQLVMHSGATLTPVNNEWLQRVPAAAVKLEEQLSASAAGEIDRKALLGVAPGPTGLQNMTGVNTETTVGLPTDYTEILSAMSKVAQDDGDPRTLIWHPVIAYLYYALKTGLTNDLSPLPLPAVIGNLQILDTTKISLTEGGGSDESSAFVGDFREMVIGVETNSKIDWGYTSSSFSKNQMGLRCVLSMDVAVHNADSFCVLSGITQS